MKTDARALDHSTLTELRKRGVAAVQSGESPTQVAAAFGVNLRTPNIDVADGVSWMRVSAEGAHRSLMAVPCAGSITLSPTRTPSRWSFRSRYGLPPWCRH